MTVASRPVVQVAFSALDPDRTLTWYRDVLGFLPAGEIRGAGGPGAAAMMDLPAVSCDISWLADASGFFQLEFFAFREPVPRPAATPRRAGCAARTRKARGLSCASASHCHRGRSARRR